MNIYGIEDIAGFISFADKVHLDHTSFIDGYIPSTHVTTMSSKLRKAHQANDKAVMLAYGFDYKTMTENECVAELMKMYQRLTSTN